MATVRHSFQCFLILLYAFSITCKSNSKTGNTRKQNANKARLVEQESTQRISANINETVVLGCNLEFPDNGLPVPYVIQWTKLNVKIPIFIWYDGYPPHTGDGYQGRTSLSGQASLQLSNVQESDKGWYECKVFFVNRPPELPKNGTWVHLDVHAPPHFKERPPEVVYVKIGESVNLACIAQATPPPVTTWFKDGRPLEESLNLRIFPGASELQIVNIQQSDIGEYQCSAKNREGSINATTKLIIAGPAVITQQPTNLTKLEGEKAELSCEAKALPSNITYKWYFNGVSISQISSLDSRAIVRQNGMLQIHPVSAEDSGIFTCEVFNGIGVPEMQSAYLNVQYPARVLYSPQIQYLPLGMSGIVKCYVEANPPANQIAWTKDGLPFEPNALNGVISLNNGSLLFQRVTTDNQGMYKCTPYNEYGTTPSGNQMEVLVKEPPVWTTKPNEIYQQQVNSELHVSCAGKGTPKPTISFRRADNAKLPKDRTVIHGGNFTLKALRKEDYGTYECVLSNEIATLVASFMVLVDSTTPHAPLNLQINTSVQSATVTWNPSYDGGYEQTYTIWYRMADQGDSDWKSIRVYPEGSTTFTLYNLASNTFYEFQVYSRNILGEGLPSPIVRAKTKDEMKIKPDPPHNVSIVRVSQGYAISWRKPLNSSVDISYYNIEYREGESGESKFWGPFKKETSYIAKLKQGESYRIRVFSHSPLGVGAASEEISYEVPAPLKDRREKAVAAGFVGGSLFFVAAIVLSVCMVKCCNERKRRKTEKAYMMVTCPVMGTQHNVAHSQTGSPIPLKQCAKNRISSVINKMVQEFYYSTGYLPAKLKAKQAVFKAKQEQAFDQILKQHQNSLQKEQQQTYTKIKPKKRSKDQIDKGGFDEWNGRAANYNNQSNYQPVPPIRKSKLLSAAIANRSTASSQAKLISNNSPVIATISSPNSTQTLQVRSHLIVHPSNHESSNDSFRKSGHHPSKQLQHHHQQILPISPIPFRPVHAPPPLPPHYQLRQFQSAPQLALKYGNQFQTPTLVNQNQLNYHHLYPNQTFHNFEPVSFSPVNVPSSHQHQQRTMLRNAQVFARKTLPPYFLNRQPTAQHQQQYYLQANPHHLNHHQQLPHSSTFIASSPPFDQQFNSARLRSLSAPDNGTMYVNEATTHLPYFSPIENAPFEHRSSSSYNPSFRRHHHQHPSLINTSISSSRFNYYSPQHSHTPQRRSFYPEFSSDAGTLIGSDSHRIETINRMRLAQLAKENQQHPSRRVASTGSIRRRRRVDDYQRPIDFLNNYANNDEFEADIEEDTNSYLFHKSLSKHMMGNRSGLVSEELTTSSGRGSSNLDNSPKINGNSTTTANKNDEPNSQPTVIKSNSSSSGFASRTFSITGSPDKQQSPVTPPPIPALQPHSSAASTIGAAASSMSRRPKKLSSANEVSEADENYEFDLESRLNALYKRSMSTCTTPMRFYDVDKDPFLMYRQQQAQQKHQQQLLQLERRRRAQQFKHIDHLIATPTSDENFDYMDDEIKQLEDADEEIRFLNDHLETRNFNRHRPTRHHLKSEPHSLAGVSRAVFSDSELYENQFNGGGSREQMMTRYWRRMRCEQLKRELNEFRMKYSLENEAKASVTTTDLLMKNETAC